MTTLASPSEEIAKTNQPNYSTSPGRRHFWLRRVHSLLGLVFGAYITVHLLVNATGFSPRAYQQNVDHIHALEPMLPVIEIVAIFIPLLFHAIYGIYIAKAGVKFNTTKYNYGGNVRYTLQRWTAFFLLLFIGYHVATLHKWGLGAFGVKGYPAFQPKNLAYQSTVIAIKQPYSSMALNVAVMGLYLLGIWSAVFHWANGMWTSAIAWGLTVTRQSQKRWGDICLIFGIFLFIVGTAAWVAFTVAGNPNVPLAETQTLSPEASEVVHAQATGGANTDTHVPANELPGTMPGR